MPNILNTGLPFCDAITCSVFNSGLTFNLSNFNVTKTFVKTRFFLHTFFSLKHFFQAEVGAFEIAGAGGRMPRAEVARYKCFLQ